mmetsp:Transcript_20910/g.15356  ORF Transcript_20910/g.15356 Transcript_20910/m.15356 type:complete len:212 (+) Transcript_20910:231-866(+)
MKVLGYTPFVNHGTHLIASKGSDVGDIRVSFLYVPCAPCTIVAQQVRGSDEGRYEFRKWNPKDKYFGALGSEIINNVALQRTSCLERFFLELFSESLEIIAEEPLSKEEIFRQELLRLETATFLPRIIGFLFMFFGLLMIFSPLVQLLKVVPLVGLLLSYSFKIALFLCSFLLAIIGSFATIGVAWYYYQPAYASLMLATVVAFLILMAVV